MGIADNDNTDIIISASSTVPDCSREDDLQHCTCHIAAQVHVRCHWCTTVQSKGPERLFSA